jgi:hypothetical protein
MNMKFKLLLIISILFVASDDIFAQKKDSILYENARFFFDIVGWHLSNCDFKLDKIIQIEDLVEDANSDSIALYSFSCVLNDAPSNIIIVEKDSIGFYDIWSINFLLKKVTELSQKYSDISNSKKDIKWINAILNIHLRTTQEAGSEAWVTVTKKDKSSFYIKYSTYENSQTKQPE